MMPPPADRIRQLPRPAAVSGTAWAHGRHRGSTDLDELTAVASHDLSTPLRLITGYLELLAERLGTDDAEAREALHGIESGARRLEGLIEGLGSYARLARGEGEAARVDCGRILADTLDGLRPDLDAADATVRVAELPLVAGYEGPLRQLFYNLVANSIAYRGEAPLRIDVEAGTEPGFHRITVRDNGIGIEPADAERVFAMFGRSEAAGARPGTGVGLAIARRVVEGHGGRIWVESVPGEGAAFHFTLPLAGAESGDDPRLAAA